MIILGALLAASGGSVLLFARPLHEAWRDMLRSMRASGVQNTIPGTDFLASARGLLWMRRVGAAAFAVGLAMLVIGAIQAANS